MRFAAINSIFVLAFLVGVVLLQIFLSKRPSKWAGLVMPGITLIYSVVMVLNLAAFAGMTTGEINKKVITLPY